MAHCFCVNAQVQEIPRLYEFLIECPMQKCNIMGEVSDSTVYVAPSKSKFTLVDMKYGQCIISFTLLNNAQRNSFKSVMAEDISSYTYFTISQSQLDFKAKAITRSDISLIVGSIFTPIKLRFEPFDFTKDISVGTTFGIKYALGHRRDTAIDGLVGIGLSTLTIDSITSQGTILYPADLLAFTISYGLVVEFGNAQVGVFSGFDFLSYRDQAKYMWIYRNKPWLSFGVGFSIFSFNVKSP